MLDILADILLRYFYLAFAVPPAILLALLVRRFGYVDIGLKPALVGWWGLVVVGIGTTLFLLVEFFAFPKGLDRLAMVPAIVCAMPAFICAVAALFFFPRKEYRSRAVAPAA